ncbi:diacylglycerol kinase [Rhizobiales bacterium RZME27]|uniref:Dihydrofolate reductase n=1 Tax=Endobacterium cereale TaxID=2663029 RepID=A0A6A8ABB6_9HYPH|nr:dihydrofolate reductase [Endobacterium cereale]MEB2843280.1 dihydrofolate reductase [Endobacterium cereale]MQY47238.1 diacylglycerol kinase [Endobacterium cereale]
MKKIPVAIYVAVADNGVIGRDGDMPWKLSTDLKRFKAMTMGKPMVMGRKTLDTFGGRTLPGRPHVVVTRNAHLDVGGVETVSSLQAGIERAHALAEESGAEEIAVIGGGEIYRQAIEIADILYVTHVEAEIADGDTFFPAIDSAVFENGEELVVPVGEKDTYPTRFVTYRRR